MLDADVQELLQPAEKGIEAPSIDHNASQKVNSLADGITNAFKDVQPQSPTAAVLSQHSADTQSPKIPTPQRRYYPPAPSPSIVPRLVSSASRSGHQPQTRRSASAELPPTPVQLGKDPAPERPRGLFSSSPGGSSRRRTRLREGHVTSSPLKPRAVAPLPTEDEADLARAEIASGIGDEVEDEDIQYTIADEQEDAEGHADTAEATAGAGDVIHQETIDPVVQEKQKQLEALQQQLRNLKQDLGKIEAFSTSVSRSSTQIDGDAFDTGLELILNSNITRTNSWLPRKEDQDLFKEKCSSYLTLFAPNGLRMSYETWEKKIKGSQKFVYQTTFAAPACWPAHTFSLDLETTIDLETNEVEEIVFLKNKHVQPVLSGWIESRLSSRVTDLDLATIAIGAGRYFEENIQRAKVHDYLTKHLASSKDDRMPELDTPVGTAAEAFALLPYLNTSSQSFSIGEPQKKTRRSLGSTKQIMLTYDIHLNWIGQTSTKVDIVMSGFDTTATKHASRLFREVEEIDGVIKAFEAVWSILNVQNADAQNDAAKMKGKKGKARRMTIFD